jgi:putative methionine-R-sulfoxide reductase with GAF domain
VTATADDYRGALEAVERILNRGGDADDVLRAIVAVLGDRFDHYAWVAISFVEEGTFVVGPSQGTPSGGVRLEAPVAFQGQVVARLSVETAVPDRRDADFLDRVATLISPYCLVGWDTGGKAWTP